MTNSERLRERNFRHGFCFGKKPRIYNIWIRMKQRCYGSHTNDYPRYGGRGISVCEEWKQSFPAFYEWAMSHGYTDELSIERMDVNGDYCPANCKWIPMREQAKNKSNSHWITYKGESKILADWARTIGIETSLLRYRLKHWGIATTFEVGNRRLK